MSLLLRLAGPMQAWARYRVNGGKSIGTWPYPTVSGVAGIIGGALGTRDLESIMAAVQLRSRVDRENPSQIDLQVGVGPKPNEAKAWERAQHLASLNKVSAPARPDGSSARGGGLMIDREFLPCTEFLVEVTASDDLVRHWFEALKNPVFMPFLGRRAYAPSFPMVLGCWDRETDPLEVAPRVKRSSHDPDAVPVHHVYGDWHGQTESTSYVAPPAATREEYLTWMSANLSR